VGKLIDGRWTTQWYDTSRSGGAFVRADSSFRRWVRADGSTDFAPAAGRYHLYVSYACPWAHRTLIVRALKGLAGAIDVSAVEALMLGDGWEFSAALPDHVGGHRYMRQVYTAADPRYTGRVTVPVLWDRERATIVSNESSEIIRMFNAEFGDLADPDAADLYPAALRDEIDAINADVYARVNNGVYRCGFATTQAAFDAAYRALFDCLDALEARLQGRTWLVGERLTEADVRLFTTLVRFDPVYHGHFKCNRRRLIDYDNLWRLTRRVYQLPGVADTVDLDTIRGHYYGSHRSVNPTGIIPPGPELTLNSPL